MSRLRKGGKYKGGSFADTFSQAKLNNTSIFAMHHSPLNVAVAGAAEDTVENDISKPDPDSDASTASKSTGSVMDVVPQKVGSAGRRSSLKDYFAKTKDIAEDKAREAELEAERAAEEEAARKAEEEREALSQGANIADSSDGGKGSGKARRKAKRAAKQAAKDEKRALMDECKGLKGKAKRQCKSSARKNFRGDRKAVRKANRKKRRSNTKKKLGKLFKRK